MQAPFLYRKQKLKSFCFLFSRRQFVDFWGVPCTT
nr:MAG TPA: hypothetical protein [Caudoviricetes sp.]